MSNTGYTGISVDKPHGYQRFQISVTVCGKHFYRAINDPDYDRGLMRARKILAEFLSHAPCAACGEIVSCEELAGTGECKGCREE